MKITETAKSFLVSELGGEAFRYFCVMLMGYAVDLLGFLFLFKVLGIDAVPSSAISKALSSICSYFAHAIFTFRGKPGAISHASAAKYFFVVAINVPLSSLMLYFIDLVIASGVVSKISSDILMLLVTYVQTKFMVFKK
ncbi:GtrA family protein [Aquabacterium lacunae]|uniref:GtrA family protein n=1 Tax=Aquabacterium lacunae TaxID=2528630 RepID=A0A4Q9H661_9BURK|nr:GtrA family protein [Aquabacterium lacunae]TBO34534.1 GtrA family protein [Aquabacterium lacunae]